jgi:hypothetical protein
MTGTARTGSAVRTIQRRDQLLPGRNVPVGERKLLVVVLFLFDSFGDLFGRLGVGFHLDRPLDLVLSAATTASPAAPPRTLGFLALPRCSFFFFARSNLDGFLFCLSDRVRIGRSTPPPATTAPSGFRVTRRS